MTESLPCVEFFRNYCGPVFDDDNQNNDTCLSEILNSDIGELDSDTEQKCLNDNDTSLYEILDSDIGELDSDTEETCLNFYIKNGDSSGAISNANNQFVDNKFNYNEKNRENLQLNEKNMENLKFNLDISETFKSYQNIKKKSDLLENTSNYENNMNFNLNSNNFIIDAINNLKDQLSQSSDAILKSNTQKQLSTNLNVAENLHDLNKSSENILDLSANNELSFDELNDPENLGEFILNSVLLSFNETSNNDEKINNKTNLIESDSPEIVKSEQKPCQLKHVMAYNNIDNNKRKITKIESDSSEIVKSEQKPCQQKHVMAYNNIDNNKRKITKIESNLPKTTKSEQKSNKRVAYKDMNLLKSLYEDEENIDLIPNKKPESDEEIDVVTIDDESPNLNKLGLLKQTKTENKVYMKKACLQDKKLNERKIIHTQKKCGRKPATTQQNQKVNRKINKNQNQTDKKTKKILNNIYNNNEDQRKVKFNQQNQKSKNQSKIYKNAIKECKKQNKMFYKSENINNNQNKNHQKQNKQLRQQEVFLQKKQMQNNVIQQAKDSITSFDFKQNDKCTSETMPSKKKEVEDFVPPIKSRLCSKLLAKRKNSSQDSKKNDVLLNINQDNKPNDVNLSEYQELIKKCPLVSNNIEILGNNVYPRTFQNKKLNIKLLEQHKIQDYSPKVLKSTSDNVISLQNSVKQSLDNECKSEENSPQKNMKCDKIDETDSPKVLKSTSDNVVSLQNSVKQSLNNECKSEENSPQKNMKCDETDETDLNEQFAKNVSNKIAYYVSIDHTYCLPSVIAEMCQNTMENSKTDQVISKKRKCEFSDISLTSNVVGSNIIKNNLESISLRKSEIHNSDEVPNNKIDEIPENKDANMQLHNYSLKYDHQELYSGKSTTAIVNISGHVNKEIRKDSLQNSINNKPKEPVSTSTDINTNKIFSAISSNIKIEQINEKHQKNIDGKKIFGEKYIKTVKNLSNSEKMDVQEHSSSNIISKQCPRLSNHSSKAYMENILAKENNNCKSVSEVSTKDSKCSKILCTLNNIPISPKRRKHNSWSSSSSSICSSQSRSRSPSPSYTKPKSYQYSKTTYRKHHLRSSRSPSCSSRSDYSEFSPEYSHEHYSKELHSPSRSYSHSKSKSHSSRHHSSHLQKKSDDDRRELEEEKIRQAEERRVVYVGNLPDNMSHFQLQTLFKKYGFIQNVKIHHGKEKNYGFVTYKYRSDAYDAIENGPKDPDLSGFEINFGSRRTFCKQIYKDLDAQTKMKEREKNTNFEDLLASYQRIRKRDQHSTDH